MNDKQNKRDRPENETGVPLIEVTPEMLKAGAVVICDRFEYEVSTFCHEQSARPTAMAKASYRDSWDMKKPSKDEIKDEPGAEDRFLRGIRKAVNTPPKPFTKKAKGKDGGKHVKRG